MRKTSTDSLPSTLSENKKYQCHCTRSKGKTILTREIELLCNSKSTDGSECRGTYIHEVIPDKDSDQEFVAILRNNLEGLRSPTLLAFHAFDGMLGEGHESNLSTRKKGRKNYKNNKQEYLTGVQGRKISK